MPAAAGEARPDSNGDLEQIGVEVGAGSGETGMVGAGRIADRAHDVDGRRFAETGIAQYSDGGVRLKAAWRRRSRRWRA